MQAAGKMGSVLIGRALVISSLQRETSTGFSMDLLPFTEYQYKKAHASAHNFLDDGGM
jgi:hypothetical protein